MSGQRLCARTHLKNALCRTLGSETLTLILQRLPTQAKVCIVGRWRQWYVVWERLKYVAVFQCRTRWFNRGTKKKKKINRFWRRWYVAKNELQSGHNWRKKLADLNHIYVEAHFFTKATTICVIYVIRRLGRSLEGNMTFSVWQSVHVYAWRAKWAKDSQRKINMTVITP